MEKFEGRKRPERQNVRWNCMAKLRSDKLASRKTIHACVVFAGAPSHSPPRELVYRSSESKNESVALQRWKKAIFCKGAQCLLNHRQLPSLLSTMQSSPRLYVCGVCLFCALYYLLLGIFLSEVCAWSAKIGCLVSSVVLPTPKPLLTCFRLSRPDLRAETGAPD